VCVQEDLGDHKWRGLQVGYHWSLPLLDAGTVLCVTLDELFPNYGAQWSGSPSIVGLHSIVAYWLFKRISIHFACTLRTHCLLSAVLVVTYSR